MKKVGLLLIGLTVAIFANGQIVKIQGGTSISKLNWDLLSVGAHLPYNETLIGYSIFAGVDYFNKQFFNLSSNIGMIRKGGQEELQLNDPSGSYLRTITEKATLDYLSINTTIDLKYPIKETISPFISVGPRFEYLLSNSKHFDILDDGSLNSVSIGLILGAGVKYDISNLQLGLRADYYLDFTKIADWTIQYGGYGIENSTKRVGISANTFTVNLTVGYRLK